MDTKNMAAEMNTVVKGCLKYRDGKKWKSRYCVIKKPSPVADRLLVSLYKDQKDLHVTQRDRQPKTTIIIEDYYGIEADLSVDKENYVLALICQKNVTVFAFEHRELMLHFEINIRSNLGQDNQYPVTVCKIPTQSKLPLGPAMLHIHGQKFCLTASKPPKLLMSWNIPELRRFGPVDGRFMFEGGSRCGKGTGVHGFKSNHADEIYRNFQPTNSGRGAAKRPHTWRRQKAVDGLISPGGRFHNFPNFEVNADHNFPVNDRMQGKRHSIGVVDYKEAVDSIEKTRLMSIENVDQERLTRIYDIPPQLVRKVESSPSIPEIDPETTHLADRNSGDGSRSNRNSGDGSRSNRNSGDGSRSNRNSGDGSRSNRYSGEGTRSKRNSGDGTRSNRNSGDGTRSNRNSGDGSKSNRNSGEGKRSKRNSSDGNRSNRNSSDSSHSSRNSGDGYKIRPSKYSAENGFHRHSDFAHRSSQALRKSLDNILAGNQNWIEDVDNEFKENTLCRKDMYKSTSALYSLLPGTETVFEDNFEICNRSESVPHLLIQDCEEIKLCEGNIELEKLTKQEEILQRELDLLEEMLQVCVDGNEDISCKSETGMSQGFADALATLTIDTDLLDYSEPKIQDINECKSIEIKQDPALLSPNLTSKIHRVPSCSKLAAPLPYLNLEKYDLGLSSSDHVHVPEYMFVRRGVSYDNLSSVAKQPTGGPQTAFRCKSLSCSDSSNVTSTLEYEGLLKKQPPPLPPKTVSEETSPPELPPKGPNLLRRQKGTSSLFNPPPENPPRIKLTKPLSIGNGLDVTRQYHLPRSGPPRVFKPTPPLPEQDDSYTLMDQFITKAISPSRTSSISLPVKEVAEDDPKSAYMDMSSIFDAPRPPLHKSASGPAFYGTSNIAGKPASSQSVRISVSEHQTPKLLESESCDLEESLDNYFLMSSVTPTDLPDSQMVLSCADNEINGNSCIDVKGAMPFPDLITVQSYRSSQTIELSSSIDSSNNNTLDYSTSVEKLDSSSNVNKSTSFFSRLIQKARSKDKRLFLTSSEDISRNQKKQGSGDFPMNNDRSPVSPEAHVLPKRSSSISQQNGMKMLAIPHGSDRQRSSSVPNAAFYHENVKGESRAEGAGKWVDTSKINKRGSQSEDTLLNLIAKDHANSDDSFDIYVEIPPAEAPSMPAINASSIKTASTTRHDGTNAPQKSTSTLSTQSECDSNIKDRASLSTSPVLIDSGVEQSSSTQRQVSAEEKFSSLENDVFTSETSSTDDEKLLALQKVTDKETVSLSEDCEESLSKSPTKVNIEAAKEEAAAIAEYVTALPPFIPPKTKISYPGGLSPVIEGLATSSVNQQTHHLVNTTKKSDPTNDRHQTESSNLDRGSEKLSKAALSKRLAKETLRIMPPKEDENGNVWIPQRLLRRNEAVNGHGVSGDDGMNTASRRNDPLNEVRDHLDALSLSPHGSTTGSPGIRPDGGPLRSSPASTTLRPRSGKEYHRIDRRRLADEHSQGSSPLSPKSPSAASIFTFDTPSSPSVRSFPSRDGESPASSPSPYMRGPYPCHSYVNLGKGADNRPNLYVNMDMTPPSSPYRRTHMPLEQIDPQLNYAEIDLSHTGSERSKKVKKGVQKTATIEYAMIDMVATAAVSKTRKEQAQSREDNLRRSGRKFSVPSVDRRTLGSGSFRDKDRGRKLSTSSVDSNG